MLVLPNQLLYWVLSTFGSILCFFPANFMSSTHTDKNNPFSRWTKRHSQFGIFSHPCFNRTFSTCLSHNSPAKGWPYRFRSRGTTGSSILDHDFGHLCRDRRIQMSGHSDFGIFNNLWASSIFTWVQAGTASAACPSKPDNLEMISMILAAVICDAEDPCSVNTAKDPELSFTISPRRTTRPLYFWCFASNSAFFRWQMSINDAKWTFAALRPCFIDHLFLTFDFCQVPRRNFLQFFPFFVHCCFCCRNFHSLRHRNKFVNQIIMLQWILTFSCNMIFVIGRFRIPITHSGGFIGFQNTRKFCLVFVRSATPTILHNFAGHSRSNWRFQFLTCVLDGFLGFLILGVDEIDST